MGSLVSSMGHTALGPMTALQWAELAAAVIAAAALSFVMEKAVLLLVRRIAARTRAVRAAAGERLAEFLRGPARALSALVLFRAFLSPIEVPDGVERFLQKLFAVTLIVAIGWTLLRVGRAAIHIYERRRTQANEGAPEVAGVRTQLLVAERIMSVLVCAFTAALALLQFDVVRNVGMSMLASAGVAGVVVGFAAQRSLGTLLAGIQLSLTQPIRIGDAVEVQKEFGFVEDIRLSYVVVRLWDGRRLMVPTPKFIEEPVVNLTKGAENLLGTIEWRVDFNVPVSLVREAFDQIVAAEPKWDGKVKAIEVTDVAEKSVTLRGLVSARNPDHLWSLRVAVREKLLDWIRQAQGGDVLPRERISLQKRRSNADQPRARNGSADATAAHGPPSTPHAV